MIKKGLFPTSNKAFEVEKMPFFRFFGSKNQKSIESWYPWFNSSIKDGPLGYLWYPKGRPFGSALALPIGKANGFAKQKVWRSRLRHGEAMAKPWGFASWGKASRRRHWACAKRTHRYREFRLVTNWVPRTYGFIIFLRSCCFARKWGAAGAPRLPGDTRKPIFGFLHPKIWNFPVDFQKKINARNTVFRAIFTMMTLLKSWDFN